MTEIQYNELKTGLSELGYEFFDRQETESTNDWAAEECAGGLDKPSVFLADLQIKGKGRLGRVWTAKEGASLTFSVMLRPECSLNLAPAFTEVFGLSVCTAVRRLCGCDALIKWPNDIVVSGKKLCGILTETSRDLQYLIIGAGINLRKNAYPAELGYKAVSVEEICSYVPNRRSMILAIMNDFEINRKIFLRTGSMAGIKERYEALLVNIGRETTVTENDSSVTGHAAGIDETGRLIFIKEDGEVMLIGSGEASVSGIY